MDADYLNKHLLDLSKLLYGKDSKCYSKSKNNYFIFGSDKLGIKNKVSKQVAIYLAIEQIKK